MRVNVYIRRTRGGGVSEQVMAMVAGLRRHGLDPSLREPGQVQECDLGVMWGVKKRAEMKACRRALILERGYLGDRLNVWTSVGFDGLNGRADFRNAGKGPERFRRHFGDLEAWAAPGGDHVLVMGQVTGDAALQGLNIESWALQALRALEARGIPARFRPHPMAVRSHRLSAWPEARGPLDEELERARWVVTYNSNSAVDAVAAGIPAVAMDVGSMAWPVSGRLAHVEPPRVDRAVWAAELAWCQWRLEEIARGDAWDHLRAGMPMV